MFEVYDTDPDKNMNLGSEPFSADAKKKPANIEARLDAFVKEHPYVVLVGTAVFATWLMSSLFSNAVSRGVAKGITKAYAQIPLYRVVA